MFLLSQSVLSQGRAVLEKANPLDIVPDENANHNDNATPTPNPHDITNNDDNTDLKSQDTKTVYDKFDDTPKDRPNAFTTESRGRINYGRRAERMVVSESSKSNKIQKTKDGVADTSEGTGAFRDSLMDSGLAVRPAASAMPSATPRLTGSASPRPQASIRPKIKRHFDPAVPDVDLSLGVDSAVASPAPSASP